MYIFVMTMKPVHYLTWCNPYQYFRCTLVTLKKTSLWGEMMTSIFQFPYASIGAKQLKPLNID